MNKTTFFKNIKNTFLYVILTILIFTPSFLSIQNVNAQASGLIAGFETDNPTARVTDKGFIGIFGDEVFVARLSTIKFKYYAPSVGKVGSGAEVTCDGGEIKFDLSKNTSFAVDLQSKLQIPTVYCNNKAYGVFVLYIDGATAVKDGGGGLFKGSKVSGLAPFWITIKYNGDDIGLWSFPDAGENPRIIRFPKGIEDGKVKDTLNELNMLVKGDVKGEKTNIGGQWGEVDRLIFAGTKFGITEYGVMDLGEVGYKMKGIDKNVSIHVGSGFNAFPGDYGRTGEGFVLMDGLKEGVKGTFLRKIIPVVIPINPNNVKFKELNPEIKDFKVENKNVCKKVSSCYGPNCREIINNDNPQLKYYILDGKGCESQVTMGDIVKGSISIQIETYQLDGDKILIDNGKIIEIGGGIGDNSGANVEFYDNALKGQPSTIGITSTIGNFMKDYNGDKDTQKFFEFIFLKIIPLINKFGIGILLLSIMAYIFLAMSHILEPEKEQQYKKHVINIIIAGVVLTILPYTILRVVETIRNDNQFGEILPVQEKQVEQGGLLDINNTSNGQ